MKAIFIQGFSGSGKTTLSQELARRTGSICIDRDLMVEEGRANNRSLSYKRLNFLIKDVLLSQKDLIVDAPFLFETRDGTFEKSLDSLPGRPEIFQIWIEAPALELESRRRKRGLDRDQVEDLYLEIKNDLYNFKRPVGVPVINSGYFSKEEVVELVLWLTQSCGRKIIKMPSTPSQLKKEITDFKTGIVRDKWAGFLSDQEIDSFSSWINSDSDNLFQSDLYLARKDGNLVGIGAALMKSGVGYIFSGCSSSHMAGAALLIQRIADFERSGVKFFRSEVFSKNDLGKKHLTRAGMVFSGKTRFSQVAPGQIVEAWHKHI